MLWKHPLTVSLALILGACTLSEEADRAYVREKCPGYESEDSPGYRSCADRALYYLQEGRRQSLRGFGGGP